MSTTTAIHSITKAAGGDAPSIASAMAGFDDVDKLLPVDQTATPSAPVSGLVWYNPTAKTFEIYNGSSWDVIIPGAWTSYSPTFTNLTLGNGAITAHYMLLGKSLFLKIALVYGSTTSTAGAVTVSIPSGLTTAAYEQWLDAGYSGAVDVGIAVASASATSLALFGYKAGVMNAFNTASYAMVATSRMIVSGVLEIA